MREVRRHALVAHTPAEMYALVNNVARYPEFVPWCRRAQVQAESDTAMTATLELARAGLHLTLTTDNRLAPGERIEMRLRDGPLASFRGLWRFVPIHAPPASAGASRMLAGCRVELEVDFEFKGSMSGLLLGPWFEASWNSLVDAFVRRAAEIYGG